MSGARIKITLDDAAAQAALARAQREARNARPLFAEIGSGLEASARARVSTTKIGPDGVPWVDLSPRWRARKAEKGYAAGILKMRGDLLASIAFEAGDAFVDIIAGPSEYAAIHQYGGRPGMRAGAAAIPARPFLGVSEADEAEIRAATEAWLAGLISP